ncbi:pyruvate kinase [bacterium]|nr:pyruvate kinase [bacterium]
MPPIPHRKTRIVCTIGPASQSPEVMQALLRAGMNVARLNFSHGDHESHRRTYLDLRAASTAVNLPLAILMDLCGPKIRLGEMEEGVRLIAGSPFILYPPDPDGARIVGNQEGACVTYAGLAHELRAGNKVLLDDGKLELVVTECRSNQVITRVLQGGILKSKKGVNLPGAVLSTPALTAKDEADLRFGLDLGVDMVALSFVRRESDLDRPRQIMSELGIRRPLIAKIEKPEALAELSEIIQSSDGIMVARGDLGIEVPIEEVPIVQKECIRLARKAARPVITATQMLETMVTQANPTRAEVTDVANAIFDGTDAVMLSGETASGAFPIETVMMMDRIAARAERNLRYEDVHLESASLGQHGEVLALAACEIAEELQAKAIVACTVNGTTVRRIAKYRPRAPILALTQDPTLSRQLLLNWGVTPVGVSHYQDIDELLHQAELVAAGQPFIEAGDTIVVVAGMPLGVPTNFVTVRQVRQR